MGDYKLTWISGNLAVGCAPLSYDDLEVIKGNGIDVIINLCGEYCDLHDIERSNGFEVFYLPIHDDSAPELEELDRALAWLDEALYLGKKALVHCRHGIGRTGTFITAYMLRKGYGMKRAEAALKQIRTTPSSFSQWQMLRKYRKRAGKLTLGEPWLDRKSIVDLSPFFSDYERLVEEIERTMEKNSSSVATEQCGREHDACCHAPQSLTLLEAAYFNYRINRSFTHGQRSEAISRALMQGRNETAPDSTHESCHAAPTAYLCPLSVKHACIAFDFRPIACRLFGHEAIGDPFSGRLQEILQDLSRQLFFEPRTSFVSETMPLFCLADVVSGKFVQEYFDLLTKRMRNRG